MQRYNIVSRPSNVASETSLGLFRKEVCRVYLTVFGKLCGSLLLLSAMHGGSTSYI